MDLLEEDLEAIGVPKTMGQVGTQLVELFEKTAIIAENSERNSEAAHDAEIILFRRILKKRLQHAEGKDHCREWQGDSEHEGQVLLGTAPKSTEGRQKPADATQVHHCPLESPRP